MLICLQSLQPTLLLHRPKASYPSQPSSTKFKTLLKTDKKKQKELGFLLKSCIETKSLEKGIELHTQIRELGLETNVHLIAKLLKLYCSCGRIDDARKLFDKSPKRNLDVFMWTTMISGYIENGFPEMAIWVFYEMLEFDVKPIGLTFSMLLKASTYLGSRQLATQLHSMLIKCSSLYSISGIAPLIRVYGSFGDADLACQLFEELPDKDITSWTAIIHTCSLLGRHAESFELFSRMQFHHGLKPNELTLVSVLPTCGFFSSLRRGQSIHAYAIRNEFTSNLIVGSALVSIYSRCGNADDAFRVFDSFEEHNVVLWTSMIEAYSMNGKFDLAFELFQTMQDKNLKPNDVTMVVILSACSHSGRIDDGWEFFMSMWEKFGIEPQVKHYACLVDMLGRAGKLDEAKNLIASMRFRPNRAIFGSLLGACLVHRNVELGERVAYKLIELEPNNKANYVMLSNIYAAVGRWDEVSRLKGLMDERGFIRDFGRSWIEIKNRVFVFGANDKSHPESKSIYEFLERLRDKIVKAGYLPSTEFVLRYVEEADKKKLLCSHSERLAIAFGLMKLPPGMPIRIAKNLRVCVDCHEAIKLISKVTLRDLVIRDTNRFHHFSQGSCSCGDYW